jgi:hypothetical protein
MPILLIFISLNVLDFEHVFCNLLASFLNNYMFYVLKTSCFIITKKQFLGGPKWKERTQDIFHQCLIHHPSLYNFILLLLLFI